MPIPESPVTIAVDAVTVSGIYARPENPFSTLVVAHGAGAGMDHPFLAGFTRALNDQGAATLRFNFPYREAGRKFPDRPPTAIAAWRAAMDFAAARSGGEPLWAAGKSFGGRMASMAVADGMDAAGLIYLGYPLHPPGRPQRIRDAHLGDIKAPQLFVEGTRDPFCPLETLAEVIGKRRLKADVVVIDDGDHSLKVRKSSGRSTTQAWDEAIGAIATWIARVG